MDGSKELLQTQEFQSLVRRRWRFSLFLSFLMIGAYFGFILILAVNKPLLAHGVGDDAIPLGIPVGVGLILFAWLLTGIYIRWANQFYDKTVHELIERVRR